MLPKAHLTPKEKQLRHRRHLRRKGLCPVQIRIPDTRTDVFVSECRRQAQLAARSAQEKLALDVISEIADWDNT